MPLKATLCCCSRSSTCGLAVSPSIGLTAVEQIVKAKRKRNFFRLVFLCLRRVGSPILQNIGGLKFSCETPKISKNKFSP